MKVRRSLALKITLGILAICLYSLGALLGLVLMSVSAWQYSRYANNPSFYQLVYTSDIRFILVLFLVSGLLLLLMSVVGILIGVLFLLLKRTGCLGLLLGLLGTGVVIALTLETIAVTLQWNYWDTQSQLLPAILENRTKNATFSSVDWFGRELSWFQETFDCCGYNNGADYSNGVGAWFAYAAEANMNVDPDLWRPRSCCYDFTVGQYDCTELVASYNGPRPVGQEGCGATWLSYLSNIQWALVGLAIAAGLLQIVLAQIPLWFIIHQLVYAYKKGDPLLEEEE